jgi:hypothetical protein
MCILNIFFNVYVFISMTGGLINIVSYGLNDLYITGAPQITFFKVVYRRHTNFSIESMAIELGELNLDEEINIPFPKIGDLITNVYFQIDLPEVNIPRTNLASDLSTEEYDVLTSTTIPESLLSIEEIEISNYYEKIIEFQKINCPGYRTAIDNEKIKNQTVEEYVNIIIESITNTEPAIEANYSAALSAARTYESSLDSSMYLNILHSEYSDINKILTEKIVSLDKYDDYTIDDVTKLVKNAMDISIQIKGYFFSKYKKKKELTLIHENLTSKFAWIEKLGHSFIDYIDVNIGGERIDRNYGEWMNIWHELTSTSYQDRLFNKIMGNVQELTTFNRDIKPAYTLNIPLSFWFCTPTMGFPIIALQYNTVSLTIKLKKIEDCSYIEKVPDVDLSGDPIDITPSTLSDIWENMGFSLYGRLLVDYVYLDSLERKRFAQSAHEYLIETLQRYTIDDVTDNNQLINLNFEGPCKELIWFARKNIYIDGESTHIKKPFLYSLNNDKTGNPIINSNLSLNGHSRFDLPYKEYYNYLQPHAHHTRTPSDGINLYSFSLFPEEHQPSSTLNFGRITNALFTLKFDDNIFKYNSSDIDPNIEPGSDDDDELTTSIQILIYTKRYNVIRFIGGMAGLAYRYS